MTSDNNEVLGVDHNIYFKKLFKTLNGFIGQQFSIDYICMSVHCLLMYLKHL